MADAKLNAELQLLISSLERAGVNTDKFKKKLNEAGNDSAKLVDLMNQLVEGLETAESSASGLYEEMKAVSKEFGKSKTALSTTKTIYGKLTDVARKLRDDEQGISDLNKRQLKSMQAKFASNKKLLSDQKAGLQEELRSVKAGSDKAEELKAALKMVNDEESAIDRTNDKIGQRLDLEKDISKNMGVTGALVGGTGALMERLGMRSGIFHDAMEDAQASMREQSKILGKNATLMDRLRIAADGFSIVAKGFGAALTDPAVLTGKILDGFIKVNKAQVEFQRMTGVASKNLGGAVTEIATMTDMLESAADLTKQTGINAGTVFSPDQLGQIADAQQLLGISGEQATQLAMTMKLTGQSADDIGNSIYDQVSAGISNKAVYDDVLNASNDILASSGGNVEELGKAANAAKKLGMDLAKVNNIADGLLDFESSIQKELEAQLLTGKRINLNKARELALTNDLGGLADELKKNGASAAEFAKMNRLEQQSLAEALGMSREELAKTVLTEEARKNMTAEAVAKARNMTLAQSKQLDIQERIQKSVDKLAQAFAPILEALVPIIEAVLSIVSPIAAGIGYLLKFKAVAIAVRTVVGAIAGFLAVKKIANFTGIGIKGFLAMKKSLTGLGGGMKGLQQGAKKLGSTIKESFTKGLGGNKVKAVFDKKSKRFREVASGKFISGDKAKQLGAKMPGKEIASASKSTKAVSPGKNIKTFLTNLSQGLKSMAGMKVLQGALNLIPASIGLVAMIPGVVGAKLMEMIGGPKLLVSMQSLGAGLTAMGTGKVLLGALGLTAAAVAFTLMIPASAGMALMGITAPMAAAGIFALIPALTALGTAMMSGVGAIGLLALVGLAVGLGAAFALIGAGAMMFGKGIAFAAQGVTLIFSQLGGLVGLLPSLYLLGPALMSIAGGLAMMAFAGIGAMPIIGSLSLLAFAATPLLALGSLFGGDDNESEGFGKIEEKLDTLIAVISNGGNVYLDGDKVGITQAKSISQFS